MSAKNTNLSLAEAFRTVASGLRNNAVRPNIHGFKPSSDKQDQFQKSSAKIRLFIGGNRSGKTVGGGVETVRYLRNEHPYRLLPMLPGEPCRGRVVAVDFDHGVKQIVLPEVARWLPPSSLINGSWEDSYSKSERLLTLENGATCEFMSYEQELEKFAGTSRHFCWYDEEPPKDIYTECQMRLLDTGGHSWLTMTPVEGMTWVYDDLFTKGETDPLIDVVVVDTTENQTLNPVEIEATFSHLTEDERKARKEGKFVQLGGLIYKNFSGKNIIDPVIPPADWMHFEGMDAGINNPTAWLFAAVDTNGRVIVYDEYYENNTIVSYHAKAVRLKREQHKLEPAYTVGDPSIRNTDPITGTSVQLEYQEHGITIILGVNDVSAGINRVSRYIGDASLTPRLYITRNCVNLLHEIQRYRWSTWASKKMQFEKNKKEEPHKKDDHACDALRYLIASRPEADSGIEIPQVTNFLRAPTAVGVYDRYDEGLKKPAHTGVVDSILGSDW